MSAGTAALRGGTLYAASPNNVFAIDARDGAVLWHNYWKSRGGTTTGTRGPSMLGNLIYFTQHDDWVLAMDARNGKEVWRQKAIDGDPTGMRKNGSIVVYDYKNEEVLRWNFTNGWVSKLQGPSLNASGNCRISKRPR